jgi:hypothetical protein
MKGVTLSGYRTAVVGLLASLVGVAAALVACLLWLLALAGTAGATPLSLATTVGIAYPRAVTCPSVRLCVVVGDPQWGTQEQEASEVAFDPTRRQSRISGAVSLHEVSGGSVFACPTVTQCTIVGYHRSAVTFNPSSPGAPRPQALVAAETITVSCPRVLAAPEGSVCTREARGGGLIGPACPTASQCVALEIERRGLAMFDPRSVRLQVPAKIALPPAPPAPLGGWRGSLVVLNEGPDLTGPWGPLACPSTTQCSALDAFQRVLTFDPRAPGAVIASQPLPHFLDEREPASYSLACPSVVFCVAANGVGWAASFDPGNPTNMTVGRVHGPGVRIGGLACPSVSQCTVFHVNEISSEARELNFNPKAPRTAITSNINLLEPKAMACPSVTQCTVVGLGEIPHHHEGKALTFNPQSPGAVCLAPRLTKRTLSQAKSLLARAHCKLGAIANPKGKTVASQKPIAGTLPPGGSIDVRLR